MDFRLTTERPLSVAILSDLSDEIGLLQYLLKIAVGPDLQCQQYAVGMLSNLNLAKTHVILLDINFGGRNYIHTLDELASQDSHLPPCIVLVDQRDATGKLRDALRAGRLGVYDFLFKADLSVSSVRNALNEALQPSLASHSRHHRQPHTEQSSMGLADLGAGYEAIGGEHDRGLQESLHPLTLDLEQSQVSLENGADSLLGITPGSTIAIDTWLDMLDERSANELNNLLRQLNQPGALARVIAGTIRAQSGDTLRFELSDIDAIASDTGAVTHLRMSLSLRARDSKSIIHTEAKAGETAAAWSTQNGGTDYWYDIAHSLPTMGLVLDDSGTITEVITGDPSSTRYFPAARAGQHLTSVTDEKNRQACEERISKALNTGTAQHQTLAFSGPDGMRWFDSTITKLRSEPGSPRKALWTAHEITQARLAYQELLKERDTLADLLDNAPVYFYQKDREGRYLRANTSYCKAYGVQSDALLGRNDNEVFNADICEQLTEGDSHILEQSGSVQYSTEGLSDPDSTMTHWIKFALTDNNGATQSLCAIGIETAKMSADDTESKKSGTSTAAHTGAIGTDFKHIVSSIVGYTEMALQQKATGRQHKLIQHLEAVLQASQRAKDLILEVGDKPAGDIETGVELPPLVDEIVQMMQPTLPPSLDFQVDIDNVTGTTSVDPLYFQRIVMQLLITARDDAKSNDKIRLSLSNMEYTNNMCASCHQPIDGPHLVLSVTTANSGINPDDLQKMIDATTKNTKGAKNNVITMSHALNGHALIDHNKETISVLLLFKQDD